jgi:hypothetical protein
MDSQDVSVRRSPAFHPDVLGCMRPAAVDTSAGAIVPDVFLFCTPKTKSKSPVNSAFRGTKKLGKKLMATQEQSRAATHIAG